MSDLKTVERNLVDLVREVRAMCYRPGGRLYEGLKDDLIHTSNTATQILHDLENAAEED